MEYNKELLHRFMTEKVAVHVKTKEEYDKFMELLELETDIRWESGDIPTNKHLLYWFKKETCIVSNNGNYLHYAYKTWYKNIGYKIIEFSDLIKSPTTNIKKADAPLTQNDRVVAYMKKEHGITTLEAFKNLGVTRLSARIHDIRDMGYVVGDEFIKVIDRSGTETRVKMYWLINEPKKREEE